MTIIQTMPPYQLFTNGVIGPETINSNHKYAQKVLKQIADRRILRFSTTYRMIPDLSVPLTNASNAVLFDRMLPSADEINLSGSSLTYWAERIYVTAYYTASAALTISIGAASPFTSVITLPISTDLTKEFVKAVPLSIPFSQTTGTGFLQLSSTGTFSISRLDIQIVWRTDRWINAGVSAPSGDSLPTTRVDDDLFEATDALIEQSLISTQAALGNTAAGIKAVRWNHVLIKDLTSVLDADLRRTDFQPGNGDIAVRIMVWARLASAGAAGQTVTFTLQDNASNTLGSCAISVDGLTTAMGSTVISPTVMFNVPDYDLTTSNYKLIASTNGATTVSLAGCYLILQ